MRDTHARGRARIGDLIDRRVFLGGAFASLATFAFSTPLAVRAAQPAPVSAQPVPVSEKLVEILRDSSYVYVSPLRSGGGESTCHGEVWYGWIDGSVVLITSNASWKARSLGEGLDSARIWVGDYGRWKKLIGRNEAFRAGPTFDARASGVRDEALLDRLLEVYETKYPKEIDDWRDRMRSGFDDGTRVLIRYTPA